MRVCPSKLSILLNICLFILIKKFFNTCHGIIFLLCKFFCRTLRRSICRDIFVSRLHLIWGQNYIENSRFLFYAFIHLFCVFGIRVIHKFFFIENIFWNIISTSIGSKCRNSWRVPVNKLIPFTWKAFFVNHKEWFFVNLFNNHLNSTRAPNIVQSPDVNFVIDLQISRNLEISLPLAIKILLLLPYILKNFVSAFFNKLRYHIINSKTCHCRLVSNDNSILTIKVTDEAGLQNVKSVISCSYLPIWLIDTHQDMFRKMNGHKQL